MSSREICAECSYGRMTAIHQSETHRRYHKFKPRVTAEQLTATIRGLCSVQPAWALALPIQQQSVLFLAARGPDGVAKFHLCKDVVRAYRATVLVAARYGRQLRWGEAADTFMALDVFGDDSLWPNAVKNFFDYVDELPHHYTMHLIHGAEILGYKHPDPRFRARWLEFYHRGVESLHMAPETEGQMDKRLSDWGRQYWEGQ